MKTLLLKKTLAGMAGVAVALAAAVTTSAQTSPVGSWDIVLSGDQKGVAHITFNPDFTLTGTEVITKKPKSAPDVNPRGDLGADRGVGTTNSPATTNTYFYGMGPIVGTWTFDVSGRIVGIMVEGEDTIINGISFRGKRSGSRLTLVGHHEGRTINYRGIPLAPVADISGNFYVTGKKDGEPYVELFNLAPDLSQNEYLVTGVGPAYDFAGWAFVSGQKQFAVAAIQTIGTNTVLSALSGSYNVTKGKGSISGIDQRHKRVTANIQKQ